MQSSMKNVATVTSKGRVTLPASLRRKYKIKKGTRLIFLDAGDEIRLVRVQDMDRVFKIFDRMRKDSKLTPRRLAEIVGETRTRLSARAWKDMGHAQARRLLARSRRGFETLGGAP